MRIVITVVMAALLLAACGEQKKDVKGTVFAPQVEAQDKARAVQDTLQQSEQKNARPSGRPSAPANWAIERNGEGVMNTTIYLHGNLVRMELTGAAE